MSFTKLALAAAIVAASGAMAFAPQTAHAATSYTATGTITINGQVIAKTCAISFTGASATNGNDATITLPHVFTSDFSASQRTAGTTDGQQLFDMKISGCDAALTKVSVKLTAGGAVNSDGDLENATSGGSNVAVRFLDASTATPTQINLTSPVTQGPKTLANNAYTFKYGAEYYLPTSASAATAGAVSAVVNYTVTYQ